MMKISRLADYATLILNHFACRKQACLSAQQVANALHLPIPTASKCLKLLNEAGFLCSTRGASGGYHLNRHPSEISLAELIVAIDGDLALTQCSQALPSCSLSALCALRQNWQYVNQMIMSLLQQVTLTDMSASLRKRVCIEDE